MKINLSGWKLRHRIFLLVAILVSATLAATLALVEFLVREHMNERVRAHLKRSLGTVSQRDHEQGEALQVVLSALANDPELARCLRTSKYSSLVEFLRDSTEPYQIVLITDTKARLLLRSNQAAPKKLEPGVELTAIAPIREGVAGRSAQGYGWFDGGLWRLATLPLKIETHGLSGSMTLGYRIEQHLVERSSIESGCDSVLVANGSVLAYNQSCSVPSSLLLEPIMAALPLPTQPQAVQELLAFHLGYSHHLYQGMLLPLGNPEQPIAFLGLLKDNEDALVLIRQARWTVGCLGLLALAAALTLSIPAIGRVANPAELLETVVETLADGLIHFEPGGAMLRLNPAAESLLQLAPESWPEKSFFGSLMLYDRDHRLLTPTQLETALETGTTIREEEGRVRCVLSEVEFDSSFVLAPILEEGRCCGGVLLFRDSSQLRKLQRQLLDLSRQAGMAEVATGTLHNVGNALNSVNVSAGLIGEQISNAPVPALVKAISLLDKEEAALLQFLGEDPKGKKLPSLLQKLGLRLEQQREETLQELATLQGYVEHVKQVIRSQQDFTRVGGVEEVCQLSSLLEEALSISLASIPTTDLEVTRDFPSSIATKVDKHKVLQILINFCNNALESVMLQAPPRKLTLRAYRQDQKGVLEVSDNGQGFSPEEQARLFTHGFTTKPQGHGFGLHNSALAAQELGGKTSAASPGKGQGATFRLELPARES